MKSYYINLRSCADERFHVHRPGCIEMPILQNRKYLGDFDSGKRAVEAARVFMPDARGCKACMPDWHEKQEGGIQWWG